MDALTPAHYPWFDDFSKRLARSAGLGRLPHGILLCAPEGSGKLNYALFLAQTLLCSQSPLFSTLSATLPCGECKNCQLVTRLSHPDLHLLKRIEEKGKLKKNISVNQVRDMIEKLSVTAQLNGWRVVIIEAVDYLNANGFNAMLKTLEEPGADSMLILCSHNLSSVPATIRSRCQIFKANTESRESFQWLAEQSGLSLPSETVDKALSYARGGPGRALDLITSGELERINDLCDSLDRLYTGQTTPFEVLQQALTIGGVFTILAEYWYRLIKKQTLASAMNVESTKAEVPVKRLSQLYDKVLELIRIESTGGNLNLGLQLQTLLVEWFEIGKKYSKSCG